MLRRPAPRSLRARGRRADLRVFLAAMALTLSSLPSQAELALLTNGRVLKVEAVELVADALRLTLPGGGALLVPLSFVERVVDDELERVESPIRDAEIPLRFLSSATRPDTPFGDRIFEAARSHGVNPRLVAAMVRAESGFDPRAISHKGARGLLQLMPATAVRFGVPPEALFDPDQNLNAGVRYLSWLIDRYDHDLPLVLAAYNAGEGSVDRYSGVPPFRETRGYIARIYSTLGLEGVEAGGVR